MPGTWNSIAHIGLGSRAASGVATAGICCAEYTSGQLIINVSSISGSLVPRWQSSLDGATGWGTLLKGATITSPGVYIVAPTVDIGLWARMRYAIGTGGTFRADFALKST